MSVEQPSPDELISGLSHRPLFILEGMVKMPALRKPSTIKHELNLSSAGLLDKLPAEISRLILATLDL